MTGEIQINIEREVYDRLCSLMVPPIDDANAVIKALLYHAGRDSRAAQALEAEERHLSYAQELERSREGVYECGGGT